MADRDIDMSLLELHPFRGQAVDVGGDVRNPAAVTARRVVVHIVGGEKEKVGFSPRLSAEASGKRKPERSPSK